MKVVTEIPDLVFCGDVAPHPAQFDPIYNGERRFHPKPKGGMWLCPSTSDYRWKHWCQDEQYNRHVYETEWTLKVKKGTRFLVIDTLSDLLELLAQYGTELELGSYIREWEIDFERIAQDYDGIWLTERGQWETRLSEPNLYGWDLESVLVFRWVFEEAESDGDEGHRQDVDDCDHRDPAGNWSVVPVLESRAEGCG
jgi:hypothetical protein